MAYTLILHIQNSEPIKGEVEELPNTNDTMIKLQNPRRMDDKDLLNVAENVTLIYFTVDKMNFIEVLTSDEEEQIIGPVRE
jgi:hypothetical protein